MGGPTFRHTHRHADDPVRIVTPGGTVSAGDATGEIAVVSGLVYMRVRLVGAGGGGGGAAGGSGHASGGGGGAAGYVEKYFTAADLAPYIDSDEYESQLRFTLGEAGAGGPGNLGSPGGDGAAAHDSFVYIKEAASTRTVDLVAAFGGKGGQHSPSITGSLRIARGVGGARWVDSAAVGTILVNVPGSDGHWGRVLAGQLARSGHGGTSFYAGSRASESNGGFTGGSPHRWGAGGSGAVASTTDRDGDDGGVAWCIVEQYVR